jgi:hypothetical protein
VAQNVANAKAEHAFESWNRSWTEVSLHTNTYPLDAVNEAMAELDHGRLRGGGILLPAGAA